MVWFEEAISLFQEVKFDGKALATREYFEGALHCAKIYEYVWGGGMICRQLEKDLKGSAGPCLTAFNLNPATFSTVRECPAEKLSGVPGFKRGLDVRDKMLWCTRALKFIVCILGKLVADETLEVHVAAKATYTEVLAPHHSWPVRQVARTALSQCPWRRNMLAKLKMANNEFIAAARELLGIMGPMVTHVNRFLVELGLEKATALAGTTDGPAGIIPTLNTADPNAIIEGQGNAEPTKTISSVDTECVPATDAADPKTASPAETDAGTTHQPTAVEAH